MTETKCFDNREGLGIWDTRYAGIQMLIEAYIKEAASTEDDYGPTVHDLLERLKMFGSLQFSLFRKHNEREEGKLEKPPTQKFKVLASSSRIPEYQYIEYPIPDFTLWLVSNQVSNDALTLREVLQQRLHPIGDEREFLDQLDKIAYSVFQSLSSVLSEYNPYGEQVQFISYFRRGTNVRTLPYAPVALIGLPITSRIESRDIVPIAHEIAHFYYWHGLTANNESIAVKMKQTVIQLQTEFRKELEGNGGEELLVEMLDDLDHDSINSRVPSILHWIEEIFADVVSVLIAGPVAGYSMQELELISVDTYFREDDGSHPTPSIRPFIHAEVLKQIGDRYNLTDLQKAAEALKGQWECIRKPRIRPEDLAEDLTNGLVTEWIEVRPAVQPIVKPTLEAYRNLSMFELNVVLDLISRVIEATLTLFTGPDFDWIEQQFAKEVNGDPKAWTTKIDLTNPYADFSAWLGNFSGPAPDMFTTTEGGIPDLWETLVDDLFATRGIQHTDNRPLLHSDLDDGPLDAEVWVELMRFPGWTIEGPTGRAH